METAPIDMSSINEELASLAEEVPGLGTDMVRLVSADSDVFVVHKEAAMVSGTVRSMLESTGTDGNHVNTGDSVVSLLA